MRLFAFNTSTLYLQFYGLHYDAVQRYRKVLMFRWNAASIFRNQIPPKFLTNGEATWFQNPRDNNLKISPHPKSHISLMYDGLNCSE